MVGIASVQNADSKAARTQHKLVSAGIRLFSEQGFEATSTRQVQQVAGVQRNLITYHFGGKEAFWKACMTTLFARLTDQMSPAMAQAADIAPSERVRFLIRRYVRTAAAHPEITRVMFAEGRTDSPRLEWLVEKYAGPFFRVVSKLLGESSDSRALSPSLTPIRFYYLLVSSASVYAMAPEYQRLSGRNPFDSDLIDEHADFMAQFLTAQLLTEG